MTYKHEDDPLPQVSVDLYVNAPNNTIDHERSYFVGIRMVRQLVDDDRTELCVRIAGQP